MTLDKFPVISEDPYGEEFVDDPYPLYERMRDAGPAVYLERYGAVATGRYDVARDALVDWERFTSARGVGLADLGDSERWPGLAQSALVEQDPPVHTHARAAIRRLFLPKRLRPMREGIAARADALVAELVERGRFDAYDDLAYAYIFSIVPDLIGVMPEGRESMVPFSTLSIQASTSPHNDRIRSLMAQASPLRAWFEIASRRENLASDGMGAEIWQMVDRDEISEELAGKLIRALMTAGMDTTMYAIVNTINALLAFPEQWARLVADPQLANFVFDETVRFESPTQTITRMASRDTEFGGVEIPEGTKVVLFNGSAGRDPRQWGDRADRYDITMPSPDHLGLGFGIHQCVGQALARMEVHALMDAFARRVRQVRLDGEKRPLGIAPLRSWSSLPIAVDG